MILAEENFFDILEHVSDHPWPGCQVELFGMTVTWMSSGIAAMILSALLLIVLMPLMAWRNGRHHATVGYDADGKPTSISVAGGMLETLVLFIRDSIARPSIHHQADKYVPFLLTLFSFVLAMNLMGMTPLAAGSNWFSLWLTDKLWHHPVAYGVGHTPTSILTVCMMLALLALVRIVGGGLWAAAKHSKLPFPVALVLSPVLWFLRLSPPVPGAIGKALCVPLALLELVGVFAKCFALMVRLFANMVAGHIMLAMMMMFFVETLVATYQTSIDPGAANNISFFYIGPVCVIGSVLVDIMELLVAGLQAYILTFLTAMFLGLYVEPEH